MNLLDFIIGSQFLFFIFLRNLIIELDDQNNLLYNTYNFIFIISKNIPPEIYIGTYSIFLVTFV